jgi:predicted outer membrane protein
LRGGTGPAVKNLAQLLAAEHGAAVKEIDGMAQSLGLRLPVAPTVPQQRSLQQLSTTGGFDTAFARSVGVEAQQGDWRCTRRAGPHPQSELKAWIEARLQHLGEQLTTAQQIPLRHAPNRTPNSGCNEATPAAPANGARP